jgi:hypothetical protein
LALGEIGFPCLSTCGDLIGRFHRSGRLHRWPFGPSQILPAFGCDPIPVKEWDGFSYVEVTGADGVIHFHSKF